MRTAQAPWQEVLGESTNGGSPASSVLLGKIEAAFYFGGFRPIAAWLTAGTVPGELVLF